MFKSLLFSLAVVSAACAQPVDDPTSMTKEDAAALSGKSDRLGDLCEAFAWYGDGVCDAFCQEPDPDCLQTCTGSNECPTGEYCSTEDGDCDSACPDGADFCPTVCAGVCVPDPEPICTSTSDCGEGEHCSVEDGDCDSPCPEGAENCPTVCAGVCVPDPEPICTSTSDCGEGEHCSVEDGDCDSACPDGADFCPTVCAGVCVPDVDLESCGGLAGPLCGVGEYCHYEPGTCLIIADQDGVCEPRPDACIDLYDPVCGCDGVTYSNSCYAAAAGVSIASNDACS